MKKTTTELEIEVSKGRKDVSTVDTSQDESTAIIPQGDIFVKVEASKLSFADKFMEHIPKTDDEQEFMEMIKKIIQRGPKDFWRPICDPSFYDNGGICYDAGKMPATGRSYNWWEKSAKVFCPERSSRLGTKSEYISFLAVLIKKLVDNDWTVQDAWDAVCNDSKKLGHYYKSKDAKNDFEPTGSREVCGWYDLANTRKILAEDKETGDFGLAGGEFYVESDIYPLVALEYYNCRYIPLRYSCGWLVLDRPLIRNQNI